MATINAPVKDFTGVVAGVHFADGQAETDNEAAIQYFERHGYGVDGSADDAAERKPAGNLEEFSVSKLREYAKAKGIALGDAARKQDILAKIEKAESPIALQEGADPAAAAAIERESVADQMDDAADEPAEPAED
ncbi:hypothetical protein GS463_27590 [Rhodococcus hoagii]|uniref:Rho termination factor N-terminal domain-containing protein n=1 Tax=Rhodococcus hoagii TaxID=43767 RepID=A0AAE3BBY4_RHOHA|nr:hypothetical protein [Prescottella equi]MBM4716173.1 hypothetical protein [Prescottella equi]